MKFSKFACCFVIVFSACTCFAQMYTVTDLGTLGGSWSNATAINASGRVVGTAEFVPMNTGTPLGSSAFRTGANSPITASDDLLISEHCMPTATPVRCIYWGWALDINDSGQAVGFVQWAYGNDWGAFRTAPNSTIADWNVVGSGIEATGINASGQTTLNMFGEDAYLSNPNDLNFDLNLATLGPAGCFYSTCGASAYGVNDSGQVVGESLINSYPYESHAFRTAPNTAINPASDDLGALGGSFSTATHINAFGQVVGYSATSYSTNAYHAFRTGPNLSIKSATDDLGTLGGSYSSASSIDNFGQVVGMSNPADNPNNDGSFTFHPFIYGGRVMYDLNNLVQAGSNCVLDGTFTAFFLDSLLRGPDINDAGQIVTNGNCSGQTHAVRLDPIYNANVQQPINADGSSVFSAKRGVVPVKFAMTQYGTQPSCNLPATIGIVRASNTTTLTAVDESTYSMSADIGSNFRIDSTACQYVYNLAASSLGVGTYRVDISINGIMVGHAVFALQ